MFDKILIANRGEIACRVIKTARKMGIKTVAVYSDADRDARHVRLADEAVHIGPAPSRESYLRMDRIIEVNEGNCSCLVEPGVSYFDMYKHLQATGSKLWLDVPDPGWGSMIGNALDSGGGYTAAPYRGHFEAQCGIEAVLADGEVLRTGRRTVKGVAGYDLTKLFVGSEGTLGVITQATLALKPLPQAPATLVGQPGGNLIGTPGDDVMVSNGATYVYGADGNDVICTTATAPSTSRALSVSGGRGTDVVDRRGDLDPGVMSQISVYGAGATVYGGPGPDQVSLESTAPFTGAVTLPSSIR